MAERLVKTNLDFESAGRIRNLAAAIDPSDAATLGQVQAMIEALAWKDDVRVATATNVNLASPGASLDGIPMATSDRVLVRGQTAPAENGIYVWNGAATPMARAADADTYDELEGARVGVTEGTDAGTRWVQTGVNGVLGTDPVTWINASGSAPPASETTAGIAEIATQAETDAATDDLRFVTPLKLGAWAGRARRFSATIGDGAATQIDVTHNLGTEDVAIVLRQAAGTKAAVIAEERVVDGNTVRFLFNAAPAANSLRATVIG